MRPRLRVKGKTPQGAPVAQVKEEDPRVDAARNAVAAVEEGIKLLKDLEEAFVADFPDASEALDQIKLQRDEVAELIKAAKPLVAAAKMTVGDFFCKRKMGKAHYNSARATDILRDHPARADLFEQLMDAGIIDSIQLGAKAIQWFAGHPNEATIFQSAWEPEHELTPAITVPKL